MTDPLTSLPIDQINENALPRDRSADDAEAQQELHLSILTRGLRQPIEVWELSKPDETHRYGLISGFRRLHTCRELKHETIPAFIRKPADIPDAMASMVAENEIRAQISPWEKGRFILDTICTGLFDTPDAAIDALYPLHARQKKTRLRSIVMAVQSFDGDLATPENLGIARIERLAAALRAGWEDTLHSALDPHRDAPLSSQWSALEPVVNEALNPQDNESAPGTRGAPRRQLCLGGGGLKIRRELTRSGWILRFSGQQAKVPGLMDEVMWEIERQFGKMEG